MSQCLFRTFAEAYTRCNLCVRVYYGAVGRLTTTHPPLHMQCKQRAFPSADLSVMHFLQPQPHTHRNVNVHICVSPLMRSEFWISWFNSQCMNSLHFSLSVCFGLYQWVSVCLVCATVSYGQMVCHIVYPLYSLFCSILYYDIPVSALLCAIEYARMTSSSTECVTNSDGRQYLRKQLYTSSSL